MSRIRILLAEGQSLFRDAVRMIFESRTGVQVVGAVGDGRQLVSETTRTRPDVVLLDADLPGCDWAKATGVVKELASECKVLLLSDEGDDSFLLRGVHAGVDGFITRSSPLEDLMDATERIHRGETLIPGEKLGPLLTRLVRREQEQHDAYRRVSLLTPREREILGMLSDGAGTRAIARALFISPQTVRKHIYNLLRKIGAHSRLEASAFVRRNGGIRPLLRTSATQSTADTAPIS